MRSDMTGVAGAATCPSGGVVHPWNDGEIGTVRWGNAREVGLPYLFPDIYKYIKIKEGKVETNGESGL